jgi:hypothetical protein
MPSLSYLVFSSDVYVVQSTCLADCSLHCYPLKCCILQLQAQAAAADAAHTWSNSSSDDEGSEPDDIENLEVRNFEHVAFKPNILSF